MADILEAEEISQVKGRKAPKLGQGGGQRVAPIDKSTSLVARADATLASRAVPPLRSHASVGVSEKIRHRKR